MQFQGLPLPNHIQHLFAVGHIVQISKLFLFLEIVDGCDTRHNDDSNDHTEAFNPGSGPVVFIYSGCLNGNAYNGGY
jgi:hypothetical protein